MSPIWVKIICAIVTPIGCGYVCWLIALAWGVRAYKLMVKDNTVSVDKFVQQEDGPKTKFSALKCVILHKLSSGGLSKNVTALPLVADESDMVKGMKRTRKAKDGETPTDTSGGAKKPPLIVGTIRMGFGHHRIAYAATSWAVDAVKGERDVYFHDLLAIESPEAQMIRDGDKLYSKASRIASELGGLVEKLWGGMTESGDEDSLRVTYQTAEHLRPIIDGLDKNSPIVASHCLVAAAAVAAGFKNVINLVIDNHAQWFTVVPGALNLVQGPSNYLSFLKMGVPREQLKLAGHWCPAELVNDVPNACKRRIDRVKARKPIRLLIPVGGAGAQKKFVTSLIRAISHLVKEGKLQLFLNAGDHSHMKTAFMEVLDENKLEFETINNFQALENFKNDLLRYPNSSEPKKNVTLFAYDEYFSAVTTTDILCNVADVLTCKPSELAFYCIPKLMIRRVGDHEQYSAFRASEIGDGTLEAREINDALDYINCMLNTPEFLIEMNKAVEKNQRDGIYDGCKNAIMLALDRASM